MLKKVSSKETVIGNTMTNFFFIILEVVDEVLTDLNDDDNFIEPPIAEKGIRRLNRNERQLNINRIYCRLNK